MSTTLATKRAVGYLRVSSVGQTGERHSSLETQQARFNDFTANDSGSCLLPLSSILFPVDETIGKSTSAC